MATYFHDIWVGTPEQDNAEFYLDFEITESNRSIYNNKTTIGYKVRFHTKDVSASTSTKGQLRVYLNGQVIHEESNFSVSISNINGTQTIVNKTFDYYHEIDGTGALNFLIEYAGKVKLYRGVKTYVTLDPFSAIKTINVTPFPRASILTAPNFTDEDNPTVTYANDIVASGTSLHAAISFDGVTDHIPYREINPAHTSYTFELTDAERETLYDNTVTRAHAPIWFLIKNALNGIDYVAKAERTLTIINATPILTPTVYDTNADTIALTGNENVLIKHFSNARASLNTWTRKKAILTGFYIKNGVNKTEDAAYTFENVTYNVFDFFVIDSRNNTKSATLTPQMVEYIKLTCNLKDNKPDTSGKWVIECNGNYYNGSFGATHNAITVQYRYKEQGGAFGNWAAIPATLEGNSYKAITTLTGLDYRKTYIAECRALDSLMEVSTGENVVKSLPVFHWSKSDFVHETPVTFNDVINGDVQITGNLRLKNPDSNYGNKLMFGDSSYVTFSENTDDDLTIKATELILSASKISLSSNVDILSGLNFNGGSVEFGEWTPALNVSGAVSYYEVQKGWYTKLGSVVTIGFNVKANINSGYSGSSIAINGAPFTPTYDAFGGGIAYNIYLSSGGLNFEGWGINTSNVITPRMQPCNNTAAGNLSIASTAGYAQSGGTMTLAGTICYLTDI